MAQKIKSLWAKLNQSPFEKELAKAENLYELETMIKRMSFVHNVKGWIK